MGDPEPFLSNEGGFASDAGEDGSMTKLERLKSWSFAHILAISFWFYVFLWLALYLVNHKIYSRKVNVEPTAGDLFVLLTLFIFQIAEGGLIFVAGLKLFDLVNKSQIAPVNLFSIYLAIILFFSGINIIMDGLSDVYAFELQDYMNYHDGARVREELMLLFLYFSAVTMTSTGYGDMYPVRWYSQLAIMIQVGCNLLFIYGLFAISLRSWHADRVARLAAAEETGIEHFWNDRNSCWGRTVERYQSCVTYLRSFYCIERTRKFIVRYIFIVAIFTQLLTITLIVFVEDDVFQGVKNTGVLILCFVVQFIEFIGIILISFRVVSKINNHEITGIFLASSYFSTVTMFGGVYFLVFLVTSGGDDNSGWHYWRFPVGTEDEIDSVPLQLWRFVYFSMITQTSTGYGDIVPVHTVTRAICTVQILIGVLYSFIILGLGLNQLLDQSDRKNHLTIADRKTRYTRGGKSGRYFDVKERPDSLDVSINTAINDDARRMKASRNPFADVAEEEDDLIDEDSNPNNVSRGGTTSYGRRLETPPPRASNNPFN